MMAALAQALIAFLPQGLAIGVLIAVLGRLMPSAAARYRLDLLGLLACPVVVAMTAWQYASAPDGAGSPLPWLAPVFSVWTVGVAALLLRTLGGWVHVQKLRAQVQPLGALAQARLRRLATQMGCTHRPLLVEAKWAEGPLTLGWLRPLVVVPVGFLTCMPPASVDALLAHELAHILRRDYLVNLVQRLIEALLFFHPVVWWLSRRLVLGRELCCDDRVVHRLGDRRAYVTGLAQLAALRAVPVPAAHGGALMHRIRRLVRPAPHQPARSGYAAFILLILLALPAFAQAPATGVTWLPTAVQAHAAHFAKAGEAHAVDPRLLAIITYVESRGKVTAKSSMGSQGLMQIMPATGKTIAQTRGLDFTVDQLNDPALNTDFGAWYFRQQMDEFKTVPLAAAAYNGGPETVRQWLAGKGELSRETQRYMKTIDALWADRDAAESKFLAQKR